MRDIDSVVLRLQKIKSADRQYGEALQFQHRKLWELRMMKQAEMASLKYSIRDLAQQQVSLYPDPCPRIVLLSLLGVSCSPQSGWTPEQCWHALPCILTQRAAATTLQRMHHFWMALRVSWLHALMQPSSEPLHNHESTC